MATLLTILRVWHPNENVYPIMVVENGNYLTREEVISLSIPHNKNGFKGYNIGGVLFTNVTNPQKIKESNRGLSPMAHCYQQAMSRVQVVVE